MTPTLTIPTLTTDRLVLRAPKITDFPHWAAFFASPRSIHERGMMDRSQAWRVWASDVAIWQLRGYGPFGVDDRETGAYLGEVGIYEPDSFPEPELGWFVVPQAEGRGIAAEAARAVMGWARDSLGWTRLINIIDPENARSIALGQRLGGVIDPDAKGEDPGDVVIVHDLTKVPA
ncbi:GNAT family N-acetyltransferase [Marinibacterium profundimaris]|uniref:Acetyltransferase n=1 Tax=Marinibacterium profundimaris TaxID=1679460 RepID=A0A225NFE3_9RHOB|nr:GNAT family N-acetyltransferase [Marinibacterium profundimaris]OWU71685.1 acetyltransferase [Marinibacterium profundimaris]